VIGNRNIMSMRLANSKILAILFVLVFATLPGRAAEGNRDLAPPVSLRIVPEEATLWGAHASQHFIVLGKYTDGLEREVTSTAHLSLSNTKMGEVDPSGKFVVRDSGEVILTAEVGGRSAKTTIRIEEADQPRPFTFARDIEGILTRQGCNDSTCHGGVKGRGGFRLSIYGIFPREDHKWIVEGGTFRVLVTDENPKYSRIDLKQPEKSLLLLKPTFSLPHGGGLRFQVGSADYETILNWVRSGAPYGDEAEKQGVTVERAEVSPREVVLQGGGQQQLVVTAYLSNGRREDITEQVRYITNDPAVADVSQTGVVQAKKRGETNILIRAAGHTLSAEVGVIEKPMAKYPKIEARNYIDQDVFAKLRRFQVLPSERSSDQEFLRRVCLDLTGTLPPPQRVREFVTDPDPHKRDRLIEILLNSPEYVDYWSFRFSDLLRVTFVTSNSIKGAKAY